MRIGSLIVFLLCHCVTVSALADTDVLVPVKGGTLAVEYHRSFSLQEREMLQHWVQEAANAIASLYGSFPLAVSRVEILPARRGNGPVPWAHTLRDGVQGVKFYVNTRYNLQAFRNDWTAVHEFSHLLAPYAGQRDIWLGEGLASYYQNVLRARAGLLSPEQAWLKLYRGFQRGENDARQKSMTLRKITPLMHKTGSYMRVYWSGAAFFLMVDVQLRAQSQGRESLDTAFKKLQLCCLPFDGTWSALQQLRQLDRLTNSDIFIRTYQSIIDTKAFPDYSMAFQRLGIQSHKGSLVFSNDEQQRRMRNAIMMRNTIKISSKGIDAANQSAQARLPN